MPNLVVPGFSGVVRILAPQRLEDHQATVALNCDFRTQDLLPMKGLGAVIQNLGPPGAASSIYQYSSSKWLHYQNDANFARTPYEDKLWGRLYVTGDGFMIPFVTDNTIVNNAWPNSYRHIGVPPPYAQRDSTGAYTYYDVPTPTYSQTGTGGIANITYTSGASSTSPPPAVVTCTAAHKLVEGTWVILDFPGVSGAAYQITLSGVTNKETQFKAKLLGVPGTKTAKAIRTAATKPIPNQPVIIRWSGHGLETGDLVQFGKNVQFSAGTTIIATGTRYSVEVMDADRFTLLSGSTPITTTATSDGEVTNIPAVRVSSSAYPANIGSVVYNANQTFTIVTNPGDSATNTWVTAEVASNQVDRSYLLTYVNGYEEEGPPSKPTAIISVTPGTPVTLDLSAIKNSAATLNKPTDGPWITKLRIYRTDALGAFRLLQTNQDATGAVPAYEIAISPSMPDKFVDSALDAVQAEPLSTEGWLPPTNDLKGITALPNGVMVGFRQSSSTGKTVCASVPFFPYAWPLSYRINTESFIVGLAPTATGLVVLTDAMPYVITGTDPASWSAVKLEAQEPCLSKRSIVDMGDYAMYASPNGLIAINGAEVKNALANIMTREQWQDYNPSSITGSFYNGRYVGSYVSGSVRNTFVYEPATGNFIDVELDLRALWNDQKTGKLWVLDPSGNLREWNAGGDMTYTWKSKLFTLPRPWNFASMQVLIEDYTKATTVQVYVSETRIPLFRDAQGVSVPKPLVDNSPFRLPSGYMSSIYQIELKGTGRVRAVGIATAVDELKLEP